MEHPWEGGKKVYINGQGRMTKMASMAINRKKTFKNLLLQNQKANDFETWCEESGNGVYKVYINHDHWMTLTFFTARSTYVTHAFEFEKLENFI